MNGAESDINPLAMKPEKQPCWKCEGYGKIYCPSLCHEGLIPNPESDELVLCPTCNGQQFIVCPVCDLDGSIYISW